MTAFRNTIVGHIIGTGLRAIGGPAATLLLPSRGPGDDVLKQVATKVMSVFSAAENTELAKLVKKANSGGYSTLTDAERALLASSGYNIQTGFVSKIEAWYASLTDQEKSGLGVVIVVVAIILISKVIRR